MPSATVPLASGASRSVASGASVRESTSSRRPRPRASAASGAIRPTVSSTPARSAPGPRASCISTTAPSPSRAQRPHSSIAALPSPRQSCVSIVQSTSRSPCLAATRSVAAVRTPHGVRQYRGRPNPARSSSASAAIVSASSSASLSSVCRTWRWQCSSTPCPAWSAARASPGSSATRSPTTKNVAGTPQRSSSASTRGVQIGSGPSSNVKAQTPSTRPAPRGACSVSI